MAVKETGTVKRIIDRIIYTDQIPDSIIARLTKKQLMQYFIWDEIIKQEICMCPRLILPLLKEAFQMEYSPVAEIKILPMEYALECLLKKEKICYSIHASLTVRIAHKDTYHVGCQITSAGMMQLQIYKYDAQIALTYGLKRMKTAEGKEEHLFEFPKSVILSLRHNESTPDEKCTTFKLPNGTDYQCQVPVIKVQNYALSDIRSRQLYILLPLAPIRFYKQFQSPGRVQARKNLTVFLEECMMMLFEEEERDNISEREQFDLISFLYQMCRYLFADDEEILHEIQNVRELLKEINQHAPDVKKRIMTAIRNESLKGRKENSLTNFQ